MEVTTTQNPIRVIRESLGKSIRQAASEIGVHHQALYLNECGAYPSILPAILSWCESQSDVAPATLNFQYLEFQAAKRRSFGEKYGFSSWSVNDLGPPDGQPIISFREKLEVSRMGLCKGLCVSSSLLYTLENETAVSLHVTLPLSFLDALLQAALPLPVVKEIDARYFEWYNSVRS